MPTLLQRRKSSAREFGRIGKLRDEWAPPLEQRAMERKQAIEKFLEKLVEFEKSRWHEETALAATQETFVRLLEWWRQDTMMESDAVAILLHPAHLQIIGLGSDALPFIFEDMRQGGGPWPTALEAITRENPVVPTHLEDAGQIDEDWLQWGQENGYVGA